MEIFFFFQMPSATSLTVVSKSPEKKSWGQMQLWQQLYCDMAIKETNYLVDRLVNHLSLFCLQLL